MHQGSITWIYGSIQGDALTSFSWHCETRCCEEGTGPYATILGGKARISCGWGEVDGWINGELLGSMGVFYLLTYKNKWDMIFLVISQLQTIDLLSFWDIEKVGDLFRSANMQSGKYVMNAVRPVCDVITGSVLETLEDFCCSKWSFFLLRGNTFRFR